MILAANPFISSYLQSDGFGKSIFWALFASSALVWTILAYKGWMFYQVHRLSREFIALFSEKQPLALQIARPLHTSLYEIPHPCFEIYKVFKQYALQLSHRSLSEADLGLIEAQVFRSIAMQGKRLDKHLYFLPMITALGPFLGLLGTVWGILLTFSQLHAKGLALSNATMLSGLSLALATTVVGLLVAIPALIGSSLLKQKSRDLKDAMEDFAHRLLASFELQYKKAAHAEKSPSLV